MSSLSVAKSSGALLIFALVLGSACTSTSPTAETISTAPVRKTIGAAGGTVASSDSAVTMTIPAGAVSADIEITIDRVTAPATGAIGQVFEIGPTGTKFTQPVTLTFRYADADLGGNAPNKFAASTVINGAWQAIASSVIDPAARTIAGTTTHLSPYAIARLAEATTVEDAGDAGPADVTPDASLDAAGPDCATLNQGKGITDAKAAASALGAALNVARDCTGSNACIEHTTPSGACYGISTGASTSAVNAADTAFIAKLAALTSAESECYRPTAIGCGQIVWVCKSGQCSL